MDIETLHNDIRNALPLDNATSSILSQSPPPPRWSLDDTGLLLLDKRIYVPDSGDLRLRILQYQHDHILASHYGYNKTLELIRHDYTWSGVRDFIRDYCKSCTTCKRAKAPCHKSSSMLQQLPIPERPWNSISMDFIEHLPISAGYSAILIIVDCLMKQGIFIPTYDTIDAPDLAKLFILHVFSKHGVPSHVTSDRGSEFISHFFLIHR